MKVALTLKSVTLLAMLTVLLLFFFPASFGSFTQTHGPTTALRAIQAICRVFAMLSSLAVSALLARTLHTQFAFESVRVSEDERQSSTCLRC